VTAAATPADCAPGQHRVTVPEGGDEAELLYRVEGDRMVILHTGVPEHLGGRGIAGRLVAVTVERAAASGLTVVPWCSYARKWLRTHPEAAATVSIDWSPPG
jgi:predicted GNAT family acetyltransferase